MKNKTVRAVLCLVLATVIGVIACIDFIKKKQPEEIVLGKGVTETKKLSDYFPGLANTSGDTEIVVLKGAKEGGSVLVLGGTHPNEPSGVLSATLLIENAVLEEGTMYVIPRANNSAFTHNDPQEGAPLGYTIKTDDGDRYFRYGSRATNPIDQWPDPDVYVHASSKQQLSGSETRNLNRAYPGRPDGNLTEKIAYGITELIKTEKIDMTIDLHEASPEYPVINAIVSHQRAMDIAAMSSINIQLEGIDIGLEVSPVNLHGLTHRELGDFTDTFAILMETANASQGRLRGKTDEALVLTGKSKDYVKAAKLGRLYVPFTEEGIPIETRVARHVTSIKELVSSMSILYPDKKMVIDNLPTYDDINTNGVGKYLLKNSK